MLLREPEQERSGKPVPEAEEEGKSCWPFSFIAQASSREKTKGQRAQKQKGRSRRVQRSRVVRD